MATRKRKASEENPKKTNTEFLWTGDEIQLLLQTSFNFKSKCEFEGLSWESVRSTSKSPKTCLKNIKILKSSQIEV